MGGGLQKLDDKFLYMNMVSRDINHGAKDFFDSYHTMSLLDPNTGRREAIIPLPKPAFSDRENFSSTMPGSRHFMPKTINYLSYLA